jgi:hypothetical protein
MMKNFFKASFVLTAVFVAQISLAQTNVNIGQDPNMANSTSGAGTEGGISVCNRGTQSYCQQCCENQKSQLRMYDKTTFIPNGTKDSTPANSQEGGQ